MPRELNGTSDLITRPGAIVTAPPFTFSCWVYLDALPPAANAAAMFIGESSTILNRHFLQVTSSGLALVASKAGAGVVSSTLGPTLQIKKWHHIAGVWTSSTNRNHAVDGVFGTANTTSIIPTGINSTAIGVINSSTQVSWFPGHIRQPAVWNVAFSPGEVSLLANRTHPKRIKLGNLVLFSELNGRGSFEIDEMSATPLDAKLTRIGRAFPQPIDSTAQIYRFPSAAAASFQPAWARANTLIGGGHGI